AGLLAGSVFLANFLPYGTFNTLSSGGTVPLLNAAIGVEVAGATVVLLSRFLDQALEIEGGGGRGTGRQGEEANRS
ncbi:sodium:proton antiporter, partial [Streptomyces sp. NPDC056728]